MIPHPTTVLCDADGNLFPSEEPAFVASADVTNEFLAALGVSARFTSEQLRQATTGKNFRTTAVDLAVAHGVPVARRVAGGRPGALVTDDPVLTADALEHWVEQERLRVTAHLAEVLRPDPAVLDPLTRLGQHYRLAAVSSSATPRLAACFAATGLTGVVPRERWYSAEDSLPVPTSKPDPAIYLHACRQLGIQPTRAVAVEDSLPGARSAVAAGVPTLGNLQFVPPAEREHRERLLRDSGVAAVVTSWTDVEALLGESACLTRAPDQSLGAESRGAGTPR